MFLLVLIEEYEIMFDMPVYPMAENVRRNNDEANVLESAEENVEQSTSDESSSDSKSAQRNTKTRSNFREVVSFKVIHQRYR